MTNILRWLQQRVQTAGAKEASWNAKLEHRIAEVEDSLVKRMNSVMEGREAAFLERLYRSTKLVDDSHQPVTDALAVKLRDITNVAWNVKVLGSELARQLYLLHSGKQAVSGPVAANLTSKLCCQADMDQDWYRYWCSVLNVAPVYHRKVWEDCFVLQALHDHDMLRPGRRGLGFAVGAEALPSVFAARGADILATDLDMTDQRASGWQHSGEHAANLRQLHKANLVNENTFFERCKFQPMDMNNIDSALFSQFDFCWSVCSFEHLGSIEKGLEFVEKSIACLKPGGIAVHTTEFNLLTNGETIDNWVTVLFRQSDIEELDRRLAKSGHRLSQVNFETGGDLFDSIIDVPPV